MRLPKLHQGGFGPFSKRLIKQLETIEDKKLQTRYALFFHIIVNSYSEDDDGKVLIKHSTESMDIILGKFRVNETAEIYTANGETRTNTKSITHRNREEFFKSFCWCLSDKTKNPMKPRRFIDLDRTRGDYNFAIPCKLTYDTIEARIKHSNKKWVNTEGLSLNTEGITDRQELRWAAAINQNTDKMCGNSHSRWWQNAGSYIPKEWFSKFNEKMVEIDIKSAQAHLLPLALFSIDGKTVSEEYAEIIIEAVNAKCSKKFTKEMIFNECRSYSDKISSQLDPYQMIADEVNKECPAMIENEIKTDRDKIKKQFNYFICKENFQGITIPLCWWMNKNFHALYNFVCDYKFHNKNSNENKEHLLHNKLFGILGKLFFEVTRMVQDKKETPFIYRFDALWVLESDLEIWLDAIRIKSFKYQIKPSLSLTRNYSGIKPSCSLTRASVGNQDSFFSDDKLSDSCAYESNHVITSSNTILPLYSRHGDSLHAQSAQKKNRVETSKASASVPQGPSIPKKRNREAKVTTDKNGRMWFSVKGKRFGSNKNESEADFIKRAKGE